MHTAAPWVADLHHIRDYAGRSHAMIHAGSVVPLAAVVLAAEGCPDAEGRANAKLIAAAPDLLEAALRLEMAELVHAHCEECEGEGVPELCGACFPIFDDARALRRKAIAKAFRSDGLMSMPRQAPNISVAET